MSIFRMDSNFNSNCREQLERQHAEMEQAVAKKDQNAAMRMVMLPALEKERETERGRGGERERECV